MKHHTDRRQAIIDRYASLGWKPVYPTSMEPIGRHSNEIDHAVTFRTPDHRTIIVGSIYTVGGGSVVERIRRTRKAYPDATRIRVGTDGTGPYHVRTWLLEVELPRE